MKGIKRKVIYVIMIIVGFLLESMFFPNISFASIIPNILLILTASIGFMRGKKEGLLIGFISGLLLDIFSVNYLGVYALLYMLVGYCNGFFKRLFYDDDIKLPIGLIAVSDLAYGILNYIFLFMLRGDFNFWFYLNHVILPEVVYTVVATLVIYQVILRINQKLETEEQRSASKFV